MTVAMGIGPDGESATSFRESSVSMNVDLSNDPIRTSDIAAWLPTIGLSPDSAVDVAGAGSWSQCWSFVHGGRELVVKVSPHRDDLAADTRAAQWRSTALPAPSIVASGDAFGRGYVVMSRARGVPLESLDAARWPAAIPAVVTLLEGLRCADVSASSGWGLWDGSGNGSKRSWDAFLASTAEPPARIGPWEEFLRSHTDAAAAFDLGVAALREPGPVVRRSLLHGDLLYRNVHVNGLDVLGDETRITGIFDWGCAMYGDHLFELSFLEFWSPWYPAMPIGEIHVAIHERWAQVGLSIQDERERRRRCQLQIGVGHLTWNASRGDADQLAWVRNRMGELDLV